MYKSIEEYLDFLLNEKGENVIIRGIPVKAIVIDITDKINYYNDKVIRTDIGLHTGEKIEYQGSEWIIISEIDKNKNSYRARMRKMNYSIKIVVEEELHEFNSIIEGISFGIEEGKYISLEAGKIQTTIPADTVSNKIDVNMRFIKLGKVWKIIDVDRSRPGLIVLHCEKDIFGVNDDKENEIADVNKIANYSITIKEENYEIKQGEVYQYTATIYKNGVEDITENISWRSSNENATITAEGLVEGIHLGAVSIQATIIEKPDIFDSIDITIIEAPPEEVITYKMWSSNTNGSSKSHTDFSVYYGSEKWFGIDKFVNGNLSVLNDTYTFSLDPNGTSSGSYNYNVIDDYKVKIVANGMGETLILTGISNQSDESITKDILLKSLF